MRYGMNIWRDMLVSTAIPWTFLVITVMLWSMSLLGRSIYVIIPLLMLLAVVALVIRRRSRLRSGRYHAHLTPGGPLVHEDEDG